MASNVTASTAAVRAAGPAVSAVDPAVDVAVVLRAVEPAAPGSPSGAYGARSTSSVDVDGECECEEETSLASVGSTGSNSSHRGSGEHNCDSGEKSTRVSPAGNLAAAGESRLEEATPAAVASTEVDTCGCRYDSDGAGAGGAGCDSCRDDDASAVAVALDQMSLALAGASGAATGREAKATAAAAAPAPAPAAPEGAPPMMHGAGTDASGGESSVPTGAKAVVPATLSADIAPVAGAGTESAAEPSTAVKESADAVPPAGFEGPEKVLEIDFKVSAAEAAPDRRAAAEAALRPGAGGDGGGDGDGDAAADAETGAGLRVLGAAEWTPILKAAQCSILCSKSNEHFDSYVLSESSLFVYPRKVILKTCGTTTLLLVIPLLKEVAASLGLEIEWASYTRKNFSFPHAQMFPHTSFNDEIRYFQRFFDVGHAYVLGPINSDFWFICVADYCDRPSSESTDRTLDMMMFDIDPDMARLFVKERPDFVSAEQMTDETGIRELLPGATIQEYAFDPCGYSMNGLMHGAYFTIHITPEAEFSYASFETNLKQDSYNALIKRVLHIFRPKRFTMTLFADREGLRRMRELPLDEPAIVVRGSGGAPACFNRHSVHHAEFEGDYSVQMANYTLVEGAAALKKPATAALKDSRARARQRLMSWGS